MVNKKIKKIKCLKDKCKCYNCKGERAWARFMAKQRMQWEVAKIYEEVTKTNLDELGH